MKEVMVTQINKMMKNIAIYLVLLMGGGLLAQSSHNEHDPFYVNEQIPSAPENGTLGEFGTLEASPYNGKVNVNVPIYNLNWEGANIPIQLSYNTGGVQVAQEASWVGLNWTLSGNYGIQRQVYGGDDFSEVAAEFIPDTHIQKSGFIYNDIQPVLHEGTFDPTMDYSDILAVHYSNGLTQTSNYGSRNLDTQPDVFTLTTFTGTYKFILKKKGAGDILETQIFDNKNIIITYNLNTKIFEVIDYNGFVYHFSTKDYSTPFNTTSTFVYPPNGGTPYWSPNNPWESFRSLPHREEASVITSWHLDIAESPRGRELVFDYQRGLQFSFPHTQYTYDGRDHLIDSFNEEQRTVTSAGLKSETKSLSIIENNYLSSISGDFGSINFNFGERLDLCTGDAVNRISNGYYGAGVLFTGRYQVRSTHGTASADASVANLLPRRLEGIEVINNLGESVINADFEYDYFNNHKLNDEIPERYLRLKLQGVIINDQQYAFDYISPNSLEAKDSFNTDFWGFANGANNQVSYPSIGRFNVSTVIPPEAEGHVIGGEYYVTSYSIVQSFVKYNGADRGSNFTYGKNGTLDKITYPTGGSTNLVYEPHEIVRDVPHPFSITEYYGNTDRFKWTSMTDEDKFDITYQYLKNAKDPDFNFFEHEIPEIQGDATTLPIGYGHEFEVDYPSLITIEGEMTTHGGADGFSYWSNHPFIIVKNTLTGEETTVFTYGDAPLEHGYENTLTVSGSFNLGVGQYRIIRKNNVPPPDVPPIPIVEYHSGEILLYTYESLPDVSALFETFEIGGTRIKKIINRDSNEDFIAAREFEYNYPTAIEDIASSGLLMDDLIFHSKTSGFYSYNPRSYSDFVLNSTNMVGGNNSAKGSHIGYSFTTEYAIDTNNVRHNAIEREFHNEKNQYFKDSFDLPYAFDGIWRDKNGNGTVEVDTASSWWDAVFGGGGDDNELYYLNNAPLNFPSDFIIYEGSADGWECLTPNCTNANRIFSSAGNARIQNTVALGLPLRLDFSYANGDVMEEKVFDKDGNLMRKNQNIYTYLNGDLDLGYYASFINGSVDADYNTNNPNTIGIAMEHIYQQGVWAYNNHTYYAYQFPLHHALVSKPSHTISYEYFNNSELLSEQMFIYDEQTQFIKETRTLASEQEEYLNKMYYPTDDEVYSQAFMDDLRSENRLSSVIQVEKFKNGEKLQTIKNEYDKSAHTSDIALMNKKSVKKSNHSTGIISNYDKYDVKGNLLQSHIENATPMSYIWGYDSLYLVAKVDNATYAQIEALPEFGTGFTISGGLSSSQKAALRSLPDAQVTTYTYKPLVGITSMTDPRGYTIYYEYNQENRLEVVKDQDGNIVSRNGYHYSIPN